MVPNRDLPKYFRARANIDVTANPWHATSTGTQGYLLEYQTIWANHDVGVYDYSIGMQDQQTSPNVSAKRDISSGHDAPKSVPEYGNCSHCCRNWAASQIPLLIASKTAEQRRSGPP
jgi:hypothetical protein